MGWGAYEELIGGVGRRCCPWLAVMHECVGDGADIAGGGLQGDGVVGFVGRDLFHVWPRGAVDDGKFPVRDRSQGGDVQVYGVRWSNRKGDAAVVG